MSLSRGFPKHKADLLFTTLIAVLASLKYFYQAFVLNPFEIDQEFLSLEAWNFLKENKFTLIGAHTSVGGMYVGPFYTYFVTLIMFFTRLHPQTINFLSALWAIGTAIALYWVGKRLFSREVGLIAGILAAISIKYLSLTDVPPLVIPLALISLLTFYALSQFPAHRKMFLVAVFLSGLALHLHFTGLYLPLFVIFWLVFTRTKVTRAELIKALIIMAFFASPLVIFDLRHNFLNSRNFITFLLTTNGLKVIVSSMLRSVHLSLTNLGALFNNLPLNNFWLSLSVWIWFIPYFLLRRRRSPYHKLLITWLIFPVVANGLYTGELLPYYYIFHHAQIFLVIGLLGQSLILSRWGCTLLVTLALLYTLQTLKWHHDHGNAFSLQNKIAAFELIKAHAGDPKSVNLSFTVEHSRRGGLDFLRRYYGFDPDLRANRPTYTIVIPHAWQRIKFDYSFGEIDVVLPPQP
ncbi:MAG: glycosyltransferase family 39 protein [Candidatus Chisholmbacteria bacterium]|nr:glycosyltransferase family 39 protein [Candidatus Chisholmbacteria bacterium]